MNDQHVQEELLQQYFDGELAPASAAEISRHLEHCDPCSRRHRALFALHDAIGRAAEESSKDVDFDALFARIEQGVQQQPAPGLAERTQVWWREQLDQRSRAVWMPAAGAIAAAAVVLLLVVRGIPTGPEIEPPEQAPAPTETASTETASSGSEVVDVDFGESTGTVFEVALDDGNSTPVVWINDEPEQAVQ
jgi:anti-sigma factor RsiW